MSDIDWSSRNFPGTITIPPPPFGTGFDTTTLEQYFKSLQELNFADDKDMVNSPAHYTQGSIECIDAIAQVVKDLNGMEAMCTGNAIKYLWRWKHKNGVEDLKKAMWYLQRMIDNYKL